MSAYKIAELIEVLKRRFSGYSYPSFYVPSFAVKLASYFEEPGRGSFIRTNIGKGVYEFGNSKLVKELHPAHGYRIVNRRYHQR